MLSVICKPYMLSVVMLTECHYGECCYAESHYAECRVLFNITLSVIMLNAIMLKAIMLNVVFYSTLCWVSLSWMSLCWMSWHRISVMRDILHFFHSAKCCSSQCFGANLKMLIKRCLLTQFWPTCHYKLTSSSKSIKNFCSDLQFLSIS